MLRTWRVALSAAFLIASISSAHCVSAYNGKLSSAELHDLKNASLDLFYHGWNNYMDLALPSDELNPITCTGLDADKKDPTNIGRNDVLGGYSVTLVDTLDMLAIIGDDDNFRRSVNYVKENVSFDIPSTVQVFETTIRGMGGLLSAHLYASMPRLGHAVEGYDGHLLKLAYDLGDRLLEAFITKSGIPLARVNLQKGYVKIGDQHITETCSSGAGSLVLEFGLLSRLTGDKRFDKAARRAFFQLWARRTSSNMIGMSIDAVTGSWQSPITGTGASIDSYYEYALKYYILFDDESFLKVFSSAYRALNIYSYDGWKYNNVHMQSGRTLTSWIDSLAAFFPSVQVLFGDIESAIRTHLTYFKLWVTFAGIPERWNFHGRSYYDAVNLEWYPLRPEFIESNYHLYRATKDPFYLQVGKQVMDDLNRYYRTECGFAGMQDLRTGQQSERMESFFLSETAKYLFLLFDDKHPLNSEMSNFVFSTEAHPFWYDKTVLNQASIIAYPEVRDYVEQRMGSKGVDDSLFNLILSYKGSIEKEEYERRPVYWTDIGAVGFKDILKYITRAITRPILKLILRGGLPSTRHHKKPLTKATSYKRSTYGAANETVQDTLMARITSPLTCPAIVPKSPLFFSSVASWSEFYSLNSWYTYDRPEWLAEDSFGRERSSTEVTSDFYNTFVDPNSTCLRNPEQRVFDIAVYIPDGHSQAEVVVSRSRENVQVIESSSLNGIRFTVEMDRISENSRRAKVLMFQNIQVDGVVMVDEWLYENSELLSLENGSLWVKGLELTNMIVNS